MTKDEICKLPAGYQIDEIIEKEYFGRTPLTTSTPLEYSAFILFTWNIVKRLNSLGWSLTFTIDHDGFVPTIEGQAGDCNCPIVKLYNILDGHGYSEFTYEPDDDIKFPLAICRFALLVKNMEDDFKEKELTYTILGKEEVNHENNKNPRI